MWPPEASEQIKAHISHLVRRQDLSK